MGFLQCVERTRVHIGLDQFRYRKNSLVRYGFWRQMYRNTNGIVVSRVTCRIKGIDFPPYGPLSIQLVILILVV
jgi:hypothetical protein